MANKKIKVFFAWQSSCCPENKTIKDVLVFPAKDGIDMEIVSSYDVAGSKDIASEIFKMIDDADLFIADLTIIGGIDGQKVSNPNVLVEWGYARGRLGLEKMISIFNEKCGSKVEDLIFDIKTKRTIIFDSSNKWKRTLKSDILKEIKQLI
jgi:hypothetical protein